MVHVSRTHKADSTAGGGNSGHGPRDILAAVVIPTAGLTTELVEYMESGLSLVLGTRDAALRPTSARAFGAKIQPAGRVVTVYLPEPGSASTLANLRDNGQIALTFSRMIDHRSLQVKGRCLSIRSATNAEREIQHRYFQEFAESLRWMGHRPALLARVRYFPSHALTFQIESMFEQTPGPGAGRSVSAEPR